MDTLPQELLIRILTFLPIPSILNFCLANKNFLFLFDDNSLWKSLYFRDFGLYFWAPEIPKEILEKCDSINTLPKAKSVVERMNSLSGPEIQFESETGKNEWIEKYKDNVKKIQVWRSNRNYSYFFTHGKTFGLCRIVFVGLPDSGKTSLLFALKKYLEENKGSPRQKRARSSSLSAVVSKLSLRKKSSLILQDFPSVHQAMNNCNIETFLMSERKYIALDLDNIDNWNPYHDEKINIFVYCVDTSKINFDERINAIQAHFNHIFEQGQNETFGLLVAGTKCDQQGSIGVGEIVSKLKLENFGTTKFKNCELQTEAISCFSRSSLESMLIKIEDMYQKLFE